MFKLFHDSKLVSILAALLGLANAQAATGGTVTGTVVYPDSKQPVAFVEVTLKRPDGAVVQSAATDDHGRFSIRRCTSSTS